MKKFPCVRVSETYPWFTLPPLGKYEKDENYFQISLPCGQSLCYHSGSPELAEGFYCGRSLCPSPDNCAEGLKGRIADLQSQIGLRNRQIRDLRRQIRK